MERTIKFRGLDLETNQWLYGSLVTFDDGTHVICHKEVNGQKPSAPVKPESVGEFTGLTDKNDVDIYEGDILFNHCENGKSNSNTVIWRLGKFLLLQYDNKSDPENSEVTLNLSDVIFDVEVAGNIHEDIVF